MNKITFSAFLTAAVLLGAACGTDETRQARSANTNSIPQITSNNEEKLDVDLRGAIELIIRDAKGPVGVYAFVPGAPESVCVGCDEKFSMQSVVKVPIAMAVLRMVDEGKLRLDEKIRITKEDLVPDRMHSPLRDENPDGGEISLEKLIEAAVSESDGTAADVLQRIAGGAESVSAYVRSIGIDGINVRYSHREFSMKPERQFENSATPRAAAELLEKLLQASQASESAENVLSERSAGLLLRFMTETGTGPNRIKGRLPKTATVAHKTGSSGTDNGVTHATNDVGVVTTSDGRKFIIAVFVGPSDASVEIRESVIARTAKAVWDKWSVQ